MSIKPSSWGKVKEGESATTVLEAISVPESAAGWYESIAVVFHMNLQSKLQAFTGKRRGKHPWVAGEASLTPTRLV